MNQLEDAIAHFMPELPSNVFGPLLAMVIVFALDWRMGLAGLATILWACCSMRHDARLQAEDGPLHRQRAADELVARGVRERHPGDQGVRAYGQLVRRILHRGRRVPRLDARVVQAELGVDGGRQVGGAVHAARVAAAGRVLMSAGQLTLPIFLTCIVIPLGFIAPLLKFAQAGGQISRMDVCLNVIWDFLGTPELVRPAERVRLDGESFAFENVSFSYHEGAEVLHGVSFETHPGQITAIVGPSGSGKSTVAKLMAGFWDATDGRVAFDGVDVRNIPYQQLMEHISYVAQDTFLFDRTLADTFAWASCRFAGRRGGRRPRGGLPRVHQPLAAGLRHARRRGGREAERRREAAHRIARAILKNAPIVILDEATAYADPENEALVERAISKLVVGKTLVTIAHRLSTVTGADQILVMTPAASSPAARTTSCWNAARCTVACGSSTEVPLFYEQRNRPTLRLPPVAPGKPSLTFRRRATTISRRRCSMFALIKRVLDLAGSFSPAARRSLTWGMVCNILKAFFMAGMLGAVFWALENRDHLDAVVALQCLASCCQRDRAVRVPVPRGHHDGRAGLPHLPRPAPARGRPAEGRAHGLLLRAAPVGRHHDADHDGAPGWRSS